MRSYCSGAREVRPDVGCGAVKISGTMSQCVSGFSGVIEERDEMLEESLEMTPSMVIKFGIPVLLFVCVCVCS
jgi:hypothetical protein